jgi:protein-S-isoprenylcysteine O-methyltransferase Ste14
MYSPALERCAAVPRRRGGAPKAIVMGDEHTFRTVLAIGFAGVFPVMLYHRLKSQATREPLDRSQEGLFILATLRPLGIACMAGVITYLVSPERMAWSSLALPPYARIAGIAVWVAGSVLVVWTLRSLGPNLTDTVVTRQAHVLVSTGPYRWVRHPFYDSVYLLIFASGLIAANWFILLTGTLVFALMAVRTGVEERNLLTRFGERYRVYRDGTGRFLPRLSSPAHRRSPIPPSSSAPPRS